MKTGKQKKLLAAFLMLVFILISAAFLIPKLVDLNRYRGWLVSIIEDAVEGEVKLGHITWGISDGIWLATDQFSITGASAFPVDLNLTNIYAKVAVLPLLSKNIEIEELTLDGPGVVIKLKPGIDEPEPEESVAFDKTSQEIKGEALKVLLPIGISVGKLSIQNGRIRIENELTLPGQKLVHNFKAVTIEASDIIPGREIAFSFSFEGDGAPGEDIILGGKTKIGCRAIVDPHDIRIEALDIRTGNNRVNADGLIRNWNGQTVVENFIVSASLFPEELAGLIPWKLMGSGEKLADSIRVALEAGGQLEIETLGVGSIPLTGPFPDPIEFLSQLKLAARVSKISIPLMPGKPKIEQVSGSIGLEQNSVTLKDFEFKTSYSPASIEALNARADITRDRINIADFSTAIVIPKRGKKTQGGRFSIKLTGRLDDWQKEPVALVQSFSTSSIPLNPVASIVPWDQIPRDQAGDTSDFLKEVLLAGGSLEVKSCSLPGINLKKPPSDIKKVLSKIKAGLAFTDIQMRPGPAYPLFDGISANITIDKGVLNISETRGRMGPATLPPILLQASGFDDDLKLTVILKGPVKVKETDNKIVDKFLRGRGFSRFTGTAQIDLNFKYFQKHPDDWVAKGSLMLEGINAESYPKGVPLHNAQGKIFFSRAETTQVSVENLSATIDDAPVKFSGKLTGGRTEDMVIEGKANIKKLDLAKFDSLVPYLDYLTFTGKLDMDLDFKIPFASPVDTLVDGRVNAGGIGFFLPGYDTKVKDTNIQIECGGGRVELVNMDTTINDQLFHLKGSASHPAEPRISLSLQSPDLNLDRLLAWDKQMPEQSETADSTGPADSSGQQDSDLSEKEVKQKLPTWAGNLTMDLGADIDRGSYRDQPFKDLSLLADYEKGILKSYGLTLNLAEGKIITKGSADFSDPEKITFVMNPDISNLEIGELSSLFKVEKMPLYGPFSITGRLEGETGNVLLSSLNGSLEAEVGPGRIAEVKHLGKLVTEIFSFINIKGLFSGALNDKIQNNGIPFKAIHSEANFTNGTMNLKNLIFISDSLNGNGQGVINFSDEKIGLQVVLEPLQSLDKLLGLVPVLGKHAQKLTKVHLTVQGPLDDPEVKTVLTKGVTQAIQGTLGIPGAVFKDTEALSGEIETYMEDEGIDNNTK